MTLAQWIASNMTMTYCNGAQLPYNKQDAWQKEANAYQCTLTYQGKSLVIDYWMGRALTEEPKIVEVVASLITDSQFGLLRQLLGSEVDKFLALEVDC